METPDSYDSRMEVSKGLHMDADPGERTVEVSRQTYDTLSQPSAYENRIPAPEISCYEINRRLMRLEEQAVKKAAWSNSVEARLESLERQLNAPVDYNIQKISSDSHPYQQEYRNYQEAFSGEVTQKDLVKENEKLKKKVTELEKRNKELLSKVIGRHKQSENMNDDSRLSAVLYTYNLLKLHDWEKLRQNMTSLTNKDGSSMIKKLFAACETHIQETIAKVNEVLGITPLDDAITNSDQGMMHDIRNILRHSHCKKQLEFYSKIVMNPPVKAEWKTQGNLIHLEHISWKEATNWRNPAVLWPIMKHGEEVVAKGYVQRK